MRTLLKNKQFLKYALQLGEMPVLETDEDGNIQYDGFTDDDGNFFPYLDSNGNQIPKLTGNYEVLYGEPVDFKANISMSGGEAEAVEYGLSTEAYSAVMIIARDTVPLVEGAIIWYTSEPEYKYNGNEVSVEINDQTIRGRFTEKTSADFIVVRKSTSLNFDKYLLTAVNK